MRFDETAIGEQLALAMNGASTRRIPLPRRHLEEIAAVEGKDRLHQAFTEARGADDERAIVILQGAGNYLRRRCRRSVDEDDQWNVGADVRTSCARDFGGRVACADAHDLLAFLEEQSADGERLIDDAAAVVAHVEHDPLRTLFLELFDRGRYFLG